MIASLSRRGLFHTTALAGALAVSLAATAAQAQDAQPRAYNIPAQSLAESLRAYGMVSGEQIIFAERMVSGRQAPALQGTFKTDDALKILLADSGLTATRSDTGGIMIRSASDPQSGSAAGDGAEGTVQALIVTAQKREENIQDVPIAMSAFTQEDLTRSQVAGGPDLMTQVPNFTFTKTNFSGYSIQIRGIGTQAISATTDAAVAVAFNNTPFIRNRFFEQEFYDLQRVEVLRGPQGTLYGRNATAGVVNIISQRPKFTYEAKLSADLANYNSTRLEGMINLPLADDRVALRIAGAWTKRDGYDTNQITGNQIDGRDLWSSRVSLRVAPTDTIEANLVWEHFQEDDDRLRSGKQLCHQDNRQMLGDLVVSWGGNYSNLYSQGCLPASLYSPDSYQAPNGYSLPYYLPLIALGLPVRAAFNPYASLVQSPDLRVIESTVDPKYRAKSDLVELQLQFDVGDNLTLTSETGYNYDNLFSSEDYNRFNTAPGAFILYDNDTINRIVLTPGPNGPIFCDPQVGCADRVVAVDVSTARSRQFSQEFRLGSDFNGPFNFSLGANFLRYDTEDKYYVFINTLTMFAGIGGYDVAGPPGPIPFPYVPGVTDNHQCLPHGGALPDPRRFQLLSGCIYIDPNPIGSLNDQGHNYFLSKNPYKLISYAAFGEAYYKVTDNLKVTAGLRFTVDKKEAPRIPSWVVASDTLGYSILAVEEQEWREPTGRLAIDWKPDLAFTDETLLYGSYSHGYKAGGSNPPPSGIVGWGLSGLNNEQYQLRVEESAAKPKTFDAEFVNAFEIGAKNTLLDGRLTLNADAFFYDYTGYQISQIIDRSAVNYNFDAKVWGAEIEADWRPLENLRLGFKGGYEKTRIGDGERAIDIMDRTAGHSDWIVVRPFPSYPSNCILPLYTFNDGRSGTTRTGNVFMNGREGPCEYAYTYGKDPVTALDYVPNPTVASVVGGIVPLDWPGYPGFDPSVDYGNNHGEGFFKDLSGHELPNAPHFTATVTADYTVPLASDWLMDLHTDFYYQSEAWTRVFNTPGYDKLKAYTNVNLAAIFKNEDAGWTVMAYVKNVMDRDSITGAFLNSDDTGLTTNVFLTEPRLFGLRVTKEWTDGAWWSGLSTSTGPFPWTVELGGLLARHDAAIDPLLSHGDYLGEASPARFQNGDLSLGGAGEMRVTYAPTTSLWKISAGVRYGKTKGDQRIDAHHAGPKECLVPAPYDAVYCGRPDANPLYTKYYEDWIRGGTTQVEKHKLADFEIGRDVGIGSTMKSTLSAGLEYAEFSSSTTLDATGVPDGYIPSGWLFKYSTHHYYDTDLTREAQFKGVGPVAGWDLSRPVAGPANGHLNVDAGLKAGVLFGRQKTAVNGTETATYYSGLIRDRFKTLPVGSPEETPRPASRSNSATVPVLRAQLGLSYSVDRVRVSAGYRWERYFNVLDAGYAEHKDYDRTLDGPYFKIAVGFGG